MTPDKFLTWPLLLFSLCSAQPCPDISLYNKAVNETISPSASDLNKLEGDFTADFAYNECQKTVEHEFQTNYTVFFKNARYTLVGSCRKTGNGCQATCPVQVKNFNFTVKQNSPINSKQLGSMGSVSIKPYDVSVNYDANVTIEINNVVEDDQPVALVYFPLFGNRKISQKNNFKPSNGARFACVNKILDEIEGEFFDESLIKFLFEHYLRVSGHRAMSKNCWKGIKPAIKFAECLDTKVNGEYLKCIKDDMNWKETNWETIFERICKRPGELVELERCNGRLFTQWGGSRALHECIYFGEQPRIIDIFKSNKH